MFWCRAILKIRQTVDYTVCDDNISSRRAWRVKAV